VKINETQITVHIKSSAALDGQDVYLFIQSQSGEPGGQTVYFSVKK
jgi:hypothetical protein